MSDKNMKDLTTGSPMGLVLSFMLPLLFGMPVSYTHLRAHET